MITEDFTNYESRGDSLRAQIQQKREELRGLERELTDLVSRRRLAAFCSAVDVDNLYVSYYRKLRKVQLLSVKSDYSRALRVLIEDLDKEIGIFPHELRTFAGGKVTIPDLLQY